MHHTASFMLCDPREGRDYLSGADCRACRTRVDLCARRLVHHGSKLCGLVSSRKRYHSSGGCTARPLAGEKLDYWLLGFSAGSFDFDETQAIMRAFAEVRLGAVPVIPLSSQAQQRMRTWFATLAQETELQTPESAEVQRSLITLILAEVTRAIPITGEPLPRSALVGKVLRYIQQYSLTPISLSDVAAAVGRTTPHVAAVVKAETGFTVGSWIASARVSKAAQLLQHTDMSIDQIAPHIGWQDSTHFIRQFRKIYGTTPAAWRRSLKS